MKNIFSLTFVGIIFVFLKFTAASSSEYDSNDRVDSSGSGSDGSLDKSGTPTVLGFGANLYHRDLDLDPDSKPNKRVRVKAGPTDCVSVFDGDEPNKRILQCLYDGFNKSRCGSNADLPCLCDSRQVRQVVTNCTGKLFDFFDPLFSGYFEELCKRFEVPAPSCTDIPNPSFPTITCEDPFRNSGFNETLKKCLSNGVDKSRCKGHRNASCLCDSISASNNMMNCTKDSETKESLKVFLSNFCSDPLKVPGCVMPVGVLVELGGDGTVLKVMDLKRLILLIIGIIIPITLGLIDN